MRVAKTCTATALLALLLVACASTETRRAYTAGMEDAKRDLATGTLAIEALGWPSHWDQEYVRLLRRQYNIDVRRVGYCVVEEETDAHARGYNHVAQREIERRFGKNVLQTATAEAEELYETKKRTP